MRQCGDGVCFDVVVLAGYGMYRDRSEILLVAVNVLSAFWPEPKA